MRTTVTLNDELYDAALKYAGTGSPSSVVAAALKAYVAQESGKRLMKLSGTAPEFRVPERQKRVAETQARPFGS